MKTATKDDNSPLITSVEGHNEMEQSYTEVSRKRKKRRFQVCGSLLTCFIVAAILIGSLVVSVIFLHTWLNDTSKQTNVVQVGGDVPVSLNDGFTAYDIATIDVTLANKTNSLVTVSSGQCIQPTNKILPFQLVTILPNSSRHQPINYYHQLPLYLLNGSSISYNITVAQKSSNASDCAGYLFLFDNYNAYSAFLSDDDNAVMNYYYKSECIFSDLGILDEISINKTSFIYAGIELNSNSSLKANISVNLLRYNTSHLEAFRLTYNDTITVVDCQSFNCLSLDKQCLFVTSPQNAEITVKYHKQNQIYGVISIGGFGFVGIIILVLVISAVVIIALKIYMYHRPASNSRLAQENSQSAIVRSNSVNFSDLSCNSSTSAPRRETTVRADSSVSHLNDKDTSSKQPASQIHGNSSHSRATSNSIVFTGRTKSSNCYTEHFCEDYIIISPSSGYGSASECDEQMSTIVQYFDNSAIPKEDISNSTLTLPQNQDSPINFDEHVSYPPDDILSKAKSVFGELGVKNLILNISGLIHHCSQYGVTLIIPEGAVQQSATVWFGACLFSDKFKFEGDYIPVSPIVWVYIDQVLLKPLELHIPHHIDLNKMSETEIKEQLFLLTAVDDNSMFSIFRKNSEFQVEIELNSQIAKIFSTHLCSNCIATPNRYYETIPKRYFVVRAEKNEPHQKIVEFIFLYQQHGCKKIVEKQSASEGFTLNRFVPVKFADNGCVHLSFDPPDINGWIRTYADFQQESLSEEEIDYYKVMGCTGGEVTEEQLENLKLLEDTCSYPPRLTIQFTVTESTSTPDKPDMVKIKFHGIISSDCTIMLTRQDVVQRQLTPRSLSSSPPSDIKSFFEATDPVFGHMLQIITACDFLKDKWYNFGVKLELTTSLLNKIEVSNIGSNAIRCTRMVLFHWRVNNKEESLETIAKALGEMGLSSLAHELRDRFSSHMNQLSTGRSNCGKHHYSLTEVPSTVLDAAPNVADLNELVGAKVEDRYHLFGTAVGLEDAYLKGLLRDYQTCQERFNQVFNKWKEIDPESFTWGTVIRVLQSNTIKANEVVEQVIEYLRQNM